MQQLPAKKPLKMVPCHPPLHRLRSGFFFIQAVALNTRMRFKTFSEYVQWREGLLAPDKPRWVGMPESTRPGMTNQQRRKLHPKKPPTNVPVFKHSQPAKLPQFKPFSRLNLPQLSCVLVSLLYRQRSSSRNYRHILSIDRSHAASCQLTLGRLDCLRGLIGRR